MEYGRTGLFLHSRKELEGFYNTQKQFSALVNGWERWEPDDKTKKDPLRTWWRNPDEKNSKNKDKSDNNKGWWEDKEDGYSLDKFFKDLDCDHDIDDDIAKRIYNEVLGDSFSEEEGKYNQEGNMAKREKKGQIMTMNRGIMGRKILVVK
jgi:hypothetical protein